VNWVLDADITKFFDTISHDWMIRFLEHRIGDRRIIRLIQKWLRAGVLEEGQKIESIEGTPQGAVISPLLANIYLHYVFDLWAERWRRRHATGDMIIVRYADDGITGFQYRRDADRFLNDLRNRLATFSLSPHPDKTRLIEFGRFAAESRRKRDEGKPETFDFLGFTHFCDRTRKNGSFVIGRQTKRSGMLARLRQIKDGLRARMNKSINDNGRWPGAVPRGALRLLRGAQKQQGLAALLRRGQASLVPASAKTWPTAAHVVGEDETLRQAIPATPAYRASMAKPTLRRQGLVQPDLR
jgi:RNA-directed DNA polymerase